MQETVVIKPGRESLALTVVVVGVLLALSVALLLTPSRDGSQQPASFLMIGVTVLLVGLFSYVRASTRIVLEAEGIVCVRRGRELRLEWSEVSDAYGKIISGNKSDREYVVLEVPTLESKISANPNLKPFRSNQPGQVWLSTTLYDEGTGTIVEAIKGRMHPEAISSKPRLVSLPVHRNLPTCPPVTHRAWLACLGVLMFGTFAGFRMYMGITKSDHISGLIFGGIFCLIFLPLTFMGIQILVSEKISMDSEALVVCYPGLTMRVLWSEICGIESSGNASAKILIVRIQDFESFRHSLPPKQADAMVNLLAGRGEGIPIKRDMLLVSLDRVAREIGERAGL
jgi:hypothetical protein